MEEQEFIEEMEWMIIQQQSLLIALKLINLNQRMELDRLKDK